MGKRTASEDINMRPLKNAKNNDAYGHGTISKPAQEMPQDKETDNLDKGQDTAGSLSHTRYGSKDSPSPSDPIEDDGGLSFLALLVCACEQRRFMRAQDSQPRSADEEVQRPRLSESRTNENPRGPSHDHMRTTLRGLAEIYCVDLAGKDELMMLSTDWLTQLKSLQNCQRPIQNIESELEQIESQLEGVFARFSQLLTKRTKSILELAKESSAKDELELHQGEIEEMLESIKEYHARQMSLRDELADLMAQNDAVGERLIKAADSQLVSAGLLATEQEEYHSDHTTARQDNSKASKRRATLRQDKEGFRSRRHNQTSNSVVQDDGPEDLLAVLQDESSRDLAEAKRAFSQASKAFHNVRETYDERYEIFQNEVEAGRLRGTKTLFDAEYFLERNRLNRRLNVAEEHWWAARKDAQRTGALPRALHTSDFADRSDDGHTPQQIEAYVASFDMARIERWRLDGAQKDIELDESKWGQGLPEHEAELASVAALSSTSQDRYDTSRRSKLIARWHKEQEDTRKVEQKRWRNTMKG
ncbi:hypothetical protein KC340_g2148 [Hortaea werneckii]|nr:hypothetical protein KC342_g1994 [Hortaea werneckii]KAI7081214.1 hypothetical protein KC339_g13378 [Hortaea werneckii]KAI7228446.1 hypothetical protein KC365_g8471 [Hortaea werneckii]KAI7335326.1 hypothetical protein KC340_g2148 [Hortaea werneckii]KAI7377285.1 hypothetical protein KC328_g14492 [Hortaea werneckii]